MIKLGWKNLTLPGIYPIPKTARPPFIFLTAG
jgi:hypothetical protein